MREHAPTITLLSDFGLTDEYVGVMKGVIASTCPQARVVDITHHIARHNVRQAAFVLNNAFRYFPKGTIHVSVVDPGVGGSRRIVCARVDGHFFLAPDNGLLTLVVRSGGLESLHAVTNEAYFLKPVSKTFHGRDIFAPVAARLGRGEKIEAFGKRLVLNDLCVLDIGEPGISDDGTLSGEIVWVDHFGNLVTNIDLDVFEGFVGPPPWDTVTIRLAASQVQGLQSSYEDVEPGRPLALFASRGLLEICVNQGDASSYFKATAGQRVSVIKP
ncbi:MAG: SAM-dependent chlorinase/fluorinase [Deltaproteobacteria bacterium]|nr:SAM-dependent chlorinase/fluorinase [Deltaproteobacteria bacterium]